MELDIYQIDAFANKAFEGNPAAVVPLEDWLSEELMQAIAAENNLAETAFFVQEKQDQSEGYRIRWFTPAAEVPLCGHATLASAYVLFEATPELTEIEFRCLSGQLNVSKQGDLICMDFPANPITEFNAPPLLSEALGAQPDICLQTADGARYVAVYDDPNQVINAKPNMAKLLELDARTVGVTAASEEYDFVSRFFAPKIGVPEDPVTGSYHTNLIPYWSTRLGKNKLHAKQMSPRGGEVFCEMLWSGDSDDNSESSEDRVLMSGRAVKYLQGTISIPNI